MAKQFAALLTTGFVPVVAGATTGSLARADHVPVPLLVVAVVLSLVACSLAVGRWLLTRHDASVQQRALEQIHVALAVFGRDRRLKAVNSAFRSLYPELAQVLVHGTPYELVLRRSLELRNAKNARVLEFEAGTIARHTEPVTRVIASGDKSYQLTDYLTAQGELVLLRIDVSKQRTSDRALRERLKRVESLTDSVFTWLWRADAQGIVLESGSTDLHAPESPLQVGAPLTTVFSNPRVIDEAIEAGRTIELQETFITTVNEPVAIAGVPLLDPTTGRVTGYFGGLRALEELSDFATSGQQRGHLRVVDGQPD